MSDEVVSSGEVGGDNNGIIEDGVSSSPVVDSYAGTKHRVKINNQEQEIPYEDLISGYGITKAAQEKFTHASKLRNEAEEMYNSIRAGDFATLKKIIPKDKFVGVAEQVLSEYLDYENMSPADKARLSAEQERDAYKRQIDEATERAKREQISALEQKVTHDLDLEIGQAIRDVCAAEGIDPNRKIEPWFIKSVVDLMISEIETTDDTAQRMPAKVATQKAWRGVEGTVKSYLSSVSPQKLIALLPREVRDAIRNADVEDAMSSMQTRIRKKQSTDNTPNMKKKSISTDDFFKKIDNRWG